MKTNKKQNFLKNMKLIVTRRKLYKRTIGNFKKYRGKKYFQQTISI